MGELQKLKNEVSGGDQVHPPGSGGWGRGLRAWDAERPQEACPSGVVAELQKLKNEVSGGDQVRPPGLRA